LWRYVNPQDLRILFAGLLASSALVLWAIHYVFLPMDAVWSAAWPEAGHYPILNVSRVLLSAVLFAWAGSGKTGEVKPAHTVSVRLWQVF
jgi:Ca2+/Na+ antiporter